jgi:hypothetical protein
MINPLQYVGRVSLPRLEPANGLLLSSAGAVRATAVAPAAQAINNLARLRLGLDGEIAVVRAGLDRFRLPVPTPVTLQDLVRQARQRIASEGLMVKANTLDVLRSSTIALRAALVAV